MLEKLRTIIVEDEELARNLMKSFLSGNDKIEIIAECENGFEGVKMINDLKPDLVFLDIHNIQSFTSSYIKLIINIH